MMNTYEQKQELESVIIEHIPLIKRIVSRINLKQTEYEREDLLHIGVLGLIEAYKRYDAKKGVPFEHFAKWRIKGSIIDELRKNGRLSRGKMDRINEYYRVQNELQQKLQREPAAEEICRAMSVTREELYEIQDNIHYLSQYSLEDVLFAGQEGEYKLMDIIEDKETPAPDERVLEKERKEILAQAVEKLTEREQLVLSLYYEEELTLREIAEVLGVTLSRVSQIHGQILGKLRRLMENA
jgi:RNA polymerase sigma factor for flagellar operon FliA